MLLLAFFTAIIIGAASFIFVARTNYQLEHREGILVSDETSTNKNEEESEHSEEHGVDLVLVDFEPVDASEYEQEAETEEEIVTTNAVSYYDVPLSDEIQQYIFDVCEDYNVPAEVILAMMKVESNFHADSIGGSGELGYMQIIPSTGEYLLSCLGINYSLNPEDSDYIIKVLLDERNNILCSVYLLQMFTSRYESLTDSLMCYNNGEWGAMELWNNGIYETYYTSRVLEEMSALSLR